MGSITRDEVFHLLESGLGLPIILRFPELVDRLALILNGYFYQRGEAEALYAQVESTLFNQIYALTAGAMIIEDNQRRPRRLRTDDIAALADGLMEPVFARLPRSRATFESLNAFAMRHTSLPALKQLYLFFGQFASEMNREIYRRIIKENFSLEMYQDWLEEA